MNKNIVLLFLILLLCVSSSCGGRRFAIPAQIPDDRSDIPQPESRDVDLYAYRFHTLFALPLEHTFEMSRHVRKISGHSKQALNVNSFDEVEDSSWFTNRNAVNSVSLDDIARGPNSLNQGGPDQSGSWTIVRAKAEGVTPGFTVKDSKGNLYVMKFDPPGYSELATGAEVVSTKLYYAAGFNAPENNIAIFHPDILVLGDTVKFTDKEGQKRLMNQDDLKDVLDRIHYLPDGRIRAMASKYLNGVPLGPFRYQGTRDDDPNDIIPHEHRRELRGLRLICAWLNHFDTKAANSFDGFVTEDGKGYVKHYLMDFGSTLGSAAHGPTPPYVGLERVVDVKRILYNFCTLGFYKYPFEKAENQDVMHPSIGYYTSKVFHPQKYKSFLPNPAFLNMTNRDAFWAAKIVMSFTDEQLQTAVEQGRYSDSAAAESLVKTLKERRDIVGRYWFGRMNPLDNFSVRKASGGAHELQFVDLAVKNGFESAGETRYQYSIKFADSGLAVDSGIVHSASLSLPNPGTLPEHEKAHSESQDTVLELKIQTSRNSGSKWSNCIKVYMKPDSKGRDYTLLGIEREE